MATLLIPDSLDLAPQAALRGLGRRGDSCDVAWPLTRTERWLNSRYCRDVMPVPHPRNDPPAFAESILSICASGRYDALLPMRMTSLEALLPYRDRLAQHTSLLMPTTAQFEIGLDKRRTIESCHGFGFPCPKTIFLDDDMRIDSIAESLGYPLVLKHRRNFGASLGVRMVAGPGQLQHYLELLTALTGTQTDLMAQEFIPGTLFDACLVARNGRIAGLVTQERRLMKPISGGVASILATVDIPQLDRLVASIVEALHWTGPAQIEFKWDPVQRQFVLIEINPRFWATTGAWLGAGANFPALAADLAMGRTPQPFPKLPANLRFMYLMGRVPVSLYQRWRTRGLRALVDARRYTRTWTDFDLRDPLPDLLRLYQELRFMRGSGAGLIDDVFPAALDPSFRDADFPEAPPVNGRLGTLA